MWLCRGSLRLAKVPHGLKGRAVTVVHCYPAPFKQPLPAWIWPYGPQ